MDHRSISERRIAAMKKLPFKRYTCPSDYHLSKDQLVSKVYDSIKLWELHDSEVSLDLAISHILNLKEGKYR